MPELPFDPLWVWSAMWPAMAIAALRATDVSLNVFRTVFVVQQRRLLAALAAGAEAATWLAAAGIVFADVTVLRAGGFVVGVATGTVIGISLTTRLRLGMVTVRIYADADATDPDGSAVPLGTDVARAIHAAGFGATVFRGTGYNGPVDMILATVRRRDAERVLAVARTMAPDAFAAIDNSPHPAPGATAFTAGRV